MKAIVPCTEVILVVKVESNKPNLKSGWAIRKATIVSVGTESVCVTVEGSHGKVTFVDPTDVFPCDHDDYTGLDEARWRAERDKAVLFEARRRNGGYYLDVAEDYSG